MFCKVDFRDDERKKKIEKMKRENFLEGVWSREGEGKMMVGPKKKVFSQNGEKTWWGKFDW